MVFCFCSQVVSEGGSEGASERSGPRVQAMGMCLSRCGHGGQRKVAVAAVSTSHDSSGTLFDAHRDERDCASQSHADPVKRFLHLYDDDEDGGGGGDGGGSGYASCEKLCGWPSIDEPMLIPPSGELFSLPSEGLEAEASAPARVSSATYSVARWSASNSRRSSSSPRRLRPGRLPSPEMARPAPPRARASFSTTPRRKSCSSVGQVNPEPRAHASLVDAIARLEKLCDAKLFLESRLLVRNDSIPGSSVAAGAGHDDEPESASNSPQESRRDLELIELLRHSTRRETEPLDGPDACAASGPSCPPESAALAQPTELQRSVDCEEEECVSKEDAAAAPAREEEGEADESDDEKLQFTDFEATFELPALPRAHDS